MNKQKIKQDMQKAMQIFQEDIATIRVGRATPDLLQNLEVQVYNGEQRMKVQELGTIIIESARSLIFQPWDKSIIKEIKNGILEKGEGLSAVIDGEKIRISLPALTTEQRGNYLKLLGKKLEGAKVMIRGIRGDVRADLQDQHQEGSLSDDDFYRLEEELQKLTDEYIDKLEKLAEAKQNEIKN